MKIQVRYALTFAAMVFTLCTPSNATSKKQTVASPDGRIRVEVTLSDAIRYMVTLDGDTILAPSAIAISTLETQNKAKVPQAMRVNHKKIVYNVDSPFYRFRHIDAIANSMCLKLKGSLSLEFQVFNEGVAYRFLTNRKQTSTVTNETAEFNFPTDNTAWLPYSTNEKNPFAMAYQNTYHKTPLSQARQQLAFLPATIDCGKGRKLTILESDIESYPGMFVKSEKGKNSLKGVFAPYPKATNYYKGRHQLYVSEHSDYIARSVGARSYPWRILAITIDDRQMPINNLVYLLAKPNQLTSTEWIKPGKVAWDWWNDWNLRGVPFKAGINTDTYKYYIDFAAAHSLEYIILDEGWYKPSSGNMLTVVPEVNLEQLVEYGRSKGVGIVLWTVFNVLDSQLQEACKKYSKMGIKGFKVDFLDRDDQTAIEMTQRIARTCADYHLILDLHGVSKPVGLNRTYPNIINYESVFGMEEVKWSDPSVDMPLYDVTFPFIRLMAGPVDYTQGAMRNSTRRNWHAVYDAPMSMGTRCHQLATYIVFDSPFTMLADAPTEYEADETFTRQIAAMPVCFDSTFVPQGVMGSHIVTVRRKGNDYYVGGLTNWEPRTIDLSFDFLPKGATYEATIIADGPNAGKNATDYAISRTEIDAQSHLNLSMESGGGFVVVLKKK